MRRVYTPRKQYLNDGKLYIGYGVHYSKTYESWRRHTPHFTTDPMRGLRQTLKGKKG